MSEQFPIVYKTENSQLEIVKEGHVYNLHLLSEDGEVVTSSVEICFQDGPVKELNQRNGWQNEELIAALVNRLEYLNGKFPCQENDDAITALKMALQSLELRTEKRKAAGVEGENKALPGSAADVTEQSNGSAGTGTGAGVGGNTSTGEATGGQLSAATTTEAPKRGRDVEDR